MEKAGTVIRRSGVKLRTSIGGSGHADLQMAIGQLKDAKATHKAYLQSEAAAWQDLTKWGLRGNDEEGENRAIQDALCQVGEICAAWAEVQREANEALRDFRRHFEMILEGERGVDAAKAALSAAEIRETRVKKDLKKAAKKKATQAEVKELSDKLESAERERDLAQLEVADRDREHQVVKTVRVREGLIKVTQSYVDMSQKCETLFAAANFVASQIPDVSDLDDASEVKYTGSGAAMLAVQTAKERVKNFRRVSRTRRAGDAESRQCDPLDPPPPYTESPSGAWNSAQALPPPPSGRVQDCNMSYDGYGAAAAAGAANPSTSSPYDLRLNSSLPYSLEAAAYKSPQVHSADTSYSSQSFNMSARSSQPLPRLQTGQEDCDEDEEEVGRNLSHLRLQD